MTENHVTLIHRNDRRFAYYTKFYKFLHKHQTPIVRRYR